MSKASGISLFSEKEEKIALADIFNTPSPNAKDGISLNIQARDFPTDLVDSIILKINMIKGPIDPNRKLKKNEVT